MTDRELFELHLAIGYATADDRLIRTNEFRPVPAPVALVGFTREEWVLRFDRRIDDRAARALAAQLDPVPPADLDRVPPCVENLRASLDRRVPIAAERFGPVFFNHRGFTPEPGVIEIDERTVELARATFPWLAVELSWWAPCYGRVEDGVVVAVCFSSRKHDSACEAGVETLPAYRGRGFGAAVTAAWAGRAFNDGFAAFYSTRFDNAGSLGIARRLGLRRLGSEVSWSA